MRHCRLLTKTKILSTFAKENSEYDQEIPQSRTADNPVAPGFVACEQQRLRPDCASAQSDQRICFSYV